MMRPHKLNLLNLRILALLLLIRAQSFGLNTDGLVLLSFKYSITSDPFGVLQSWNNHDENLCSWNGVVCGSPGSGPAYFRVTGLSLPDSGLLGSIPATIGSIRHLQYLNLSNNSINGSIPLTLLHASELRILDLSNNRISGGLPELVGNLQNLQLLNLSDNALSGNLPVNLTTLQNLTAVYLKNNYFSGSIPGGFNSVEVLDLSSNLINGSLPPDFCGARLSYLNVSFNRLSGEIPPPFAAQIPNNATIDVSGNPGLCGKPLKNLCPVPSSAGNAPNASPPNSPAIAAIPKTFDSTPATAGKKQKLTQLKSGTILAIVIGDAAGIGIIAMILFCVYKTKKGKSNEKGIKNGKEFDWASTASSSEEYNWLRTWPCLKTQRHAADDDEEETTSDSTISDKENTENLAHA